MAKNKATVTAELHQKNKKANNRFTQSIVSLNKYYTTISNKLRFF